MAALTEQPDYKKVRNCWKWLKNKLIAEGSQLVSAAKQLKLPAVDGKKYRTDLVDTEQMLWLMQFILSKRAELLVTTHREDHVCADMAILCRHHSEMDMCAEFLRKRKLPHQLRRNSSSVFDPAHDSIKVLTLHVSKGLKFPVVALVGAGRMPAEGEDEREEARLFYVGATQRLVIGVSGGGKFASRFAV